MVVSAILGTIGFTLGGAMSRLGVLNKGVGNIPVPKMKKPLFFYAEQKVIVVLRRDGFPAS